MLMYLIGSIAVIILSLASGYLLGWHGHARMIEKRRRFWQRWDRWTWEPARRNGTGHRARFSEEDL